MIRISVLVAILIALAAAGKAEATHGTLPTPGCVYNPCVLTVGNHFGEYGAANGQGADYQRAVEFVINDWSKSGVFLKLVPSTVPNKSQVSNESTNPCQGGMITVCVCPGTQGLYSGGKFTACVGCPVGGSCDVTSATTKYNLCWTIGKTLGLSLRLGQATCVGNGNYTHPDLHDTQTVAALHVDLGPGCIGGSSVVCSALTVQDADEDNDGVENLAEANCGDGALWYDAGKVPEKRLHISSGDENGNGLTNEFLGQSYAPGNTTDLYSYSRIDLFDCDGDGHEGSIEAHIGTSDQDRCGYDTYSEWPPDFVSGGFFGSTNAIRIDDLNTFLAPQRRLDTDPGDPNYDVRWDLEPGQGLFLYTINIADLTRMLSHPRAYPPMLNYVWSFNGPTCSD